MRRSRTEGSRHWTVVVALTVIIGASGAVLSGCGSGGGSSDGGLCEQCGETDGPCQDTVTVSGADAQTLCGQASCTVDLACFRKLGSAQRRCFPADAQFEQFRCDGERANRSTVTPTPSATATPTGTLTPTATGPTATGVTPTPTPAPSATPVPTVTPACGNGVVDEVDEQCDGAAFDDSTCDDVVCTCGDFCEAPGGTLACSADCTIDFSQCTGGGCEF